MNKDYYIDTRNFGQTKGDYIATNVSLPTAEEYAAAHLPNYEQLSVWSEPKYRCPKCSEGGMCRNEQIVLASYPPKYEYSCNKCGYVEYQNG